MKSLKGQIRSVVLCIGLFGFGANVGLGAADQPADGRGRLTREEAVLVTLTASVDNTERKSPE